MSKIEVNEIAARSGTTITIPTGDTLTVTSNATVGGALDVDTIKGKTAAGSILVTGEGNSTTTNLQQGLAKSWINLNGTGTIAALSLIHI